MGDGFQCSGCGPHYHVEQELKWGLDVLQKVGVDTPQLDAEVLMSHLVSLTRTQLIAHPERQLSEDEHERFHQWVRRRAERYPLPYIIGRKEFWGLDFEVNPSVLIPRPETELLVEAVSEWLRGRPAQLIAEIGLGSGAIAVALAKELPDATIFGTEISPEAAATAQLNVEAHGVSDRVKVLVGDLAEPLFAQGLRGKVDALVSNPPYISSDAVDTLQPEVLYEPRSATIAGPDALHFHRRILSAAPELLRDGGRLFLEIDPEQSEPIAQMGAGLNIRFLESRPDLSGLERIAILECASAE